MVWRSQTANPVFKKIAALGAVGALFAAIGAL